jgi:hypothetical protein
LIISSNIPFPFSNIPHIPPGAYPAPSICERRTASTPYRRCE